MADVTTSVTTELRGCSQVANISEPPRFVAHVENKFAEAVAK